MKTRSLVQFSLASLLALGACTDRPTDPAAQNEPAAEAAPPRVASLRGLEGYASRGEPGGKGFTYGRNGEPIEVSYTIHGGLAIWEGDVVIGRAGQVPKTAAELLARRPPAGFGPQRGAAIDGDGFRWPGGVVPYEIAGDLPNQARVTNAISMVEVATAGVNLVPRSGQANYVRFVTSDGCSSAIGMQGGQQNINLGDGCSTGNAAHEILHALAMFHEQSRCDRDDFVTINLDQVEPGKEGNFDKVCDGATDYDVYAEGSMMHYGPFAFAIGDLPTITSKRGLDNLMGQRDNLGTTDVFTINTLYGANNQAPTALIAALAASYPEGTAVGFNGSGSSDPDDEVLTYAWTFGDGACVSQCTVANPSHTYADNGAYNVNLTVSDGFLTDGDTKVATITNVPPTVNAGANTSVNEGSLFSRGGSFTDPGSADTWSGTVNYGDGGGVQPLALTVAKMFTLSHTYLDNGAYTINVAVTDDDGGVGNDDVSMTVNNVAPTVNAGSDATVTSGETYNFSGTFSDPGVLDAPWDWEIDWGFGTDATGSTNNQAAAIVSSIQVCVAGTYNVVLSVTDKDDGTGTDNLTLTVPFFAIGIDISPGSTPNPIAMSNRGLLPVAILSTATFDATQVDPATVVLGNEAGTDTPVAQRNNGTYLATTEDVNGDGRLDMVVQFRVPELVANGDVAPGTTKLVLRGFEVDGCTNFRGEDNVVVVP